MINDKTIAYLLVRRRQVWRRHLDLLDEHCRIMGIMDDDGGGRRQQLYNRMMDEVMAERNQKYPLPQGITDNDYPEYKPFMRSSYENCYIGKDGNITDAGMFDLEDD